MRFHIKDISEKKAAKQEYEELHAQAIERGKRRWGSDVAPLFDELDIGNDPW